MCSCFKYKYISEEIEKIFKQKSIQFFIEYFQEVFQSQDKMMYVVKVIYNWKVNLGFSMLS